jgi:hypothetical protein
MRTLNAVKIIFKVVNNMSASGISDNKISKIFDRELQKGYTEN